MAKSAWKFLKTNRHEFYKYFIELRVVKKRKGLQNLGLVKNNIVFNPINYMHIYFFHLGNCYILKRFYKYSIRSKGIAFLKFKKPFNFRPKKKKKK